MSSNAHRPHRHDIQIVRPTQFDPYDSTPVGGAQAFMRYRLAIEQFRAEPAIRISRIDLTLAIFFDVLAVVFAFAPWVQYQTRFGTVATRNAVGSDGVFLVIVASIAVIALVFVWFMEDAAIPATVAFVATFLGLLIAGSNWIWVDSIHPADATIWQSPTTGWGVAAATFACLLGSIYTWSVMRIARIF